MSSMPAHPHPSPPRRRRRGPLLVLLAAVLLGHAVLLGGLGRERLPSPRPGPLPAPVMWTRAVPAPPQAVAAATPEPVPAAADEPPKTERPAPAVPAREPAPALVAQAVPETPARTPSDSLPTARRLTAPETPAPLAEAAVPPIPALPHPAAVAASGTGAGTETATTTTPASAPATATATATATGREASAAPRPAADNGADADEPDTPAAGGSAPPLYATRLPGPAQLRFQLRRGPQRGQAVLQWQPADDRYAISFDAIAGQRPLIEQRSSGRRGSQGLSPERFQDKRRGRSAQHASFDAESQRIAFSGRAPDLPLWAGAQDRLGWIVQLAGIVAAAAQPPEEVRLYVVGARGGAGPWTFVARGTENLATPLGPVQALYYERAPAVLRDQRVEAWLDPGRGHWPVKLRFTPVLGGPPLELVLEEEPRQP